jgi:hypothetical protein
LLTDAICPGASETKNPVFLLPESPIGRGSAGRSEQRTVSKYRDETEEYQTRQNKPNQLKRIHTIKGDYNNEQLSF